MFRPRTALAVALTGRHTRPMALHDRPTLRRVIYATSFEAGGVALSTALLLVMSDASAGGSFVFSVLASTVAMIWNLAFNAMFEAWERRQTVKGRSFARRSAHAILFEAGLVLMLLPLTAWWFGADRCLPDLHLGLHLRLRPHLRPSGLGPLTPRPCTPRAFLYKAASFPHYHEPAQPLVDGQRKGRTPVL